MLCHAVGVPVVLAVGFLLYIMLFPAPPGAAHHSLTGSFFYFVNMRTKINQAGMKLSIVLRQLTLELK